jgi:uncharacterized membrane protein YciS (DUF1049 family)
MAGGLILNWILGVILFFALWVVIMSAIRKISQRYQKKKEIEEEENKEEVKS